MRVPWPPSPPAQLIATPSEQTSVDTLILQLNWARAGRVRVRIPDGLELVAGDTTFHSDHPPPFDPFHLVQLPPDPKLKVRAIRPGTYRVDCRWDFTRSGWSELSEASVAVVADRSGVRSGATVLRRLEFVRDGRRFRLGRDAWLVPLADDETFDIEEYLRHGRPARVTRAPHASCRTCCSSGPDTVSFWALIDPVGKLLQAAPLPGKSIDAVALATAALPKGRYRPAKIGRRCVSDVCLVQVRLTRR